MWTLVTWTLASVVKYEAFNTSTCAGPAAGAFSRPAAGCHNSEQSFACSGVDLLVRYHRGCAGAPPTRPCEIGPNAPPFDNCVVAARPGVCRDVTHAATTQSWRLTFDCQPVVETFYATSARRVLVESLGRDENANATFCLDNLFDDNETEVSPLYSVGVGLSLVSSTVTNFGANGAPPPHRASALRAVRSPTSACVLSPAHSWLPQFKSSRSRRSKPGQTRARCARCRCGCWASASS